MYDEFGSNSNDIWRLWDSLCQAQVSAILNIQNLRSIFGYTVDVFVCVIKFNVLLRSPTCSFVQFFGFFSSARLFVRSFIELHTKGTFYYNIDPDNLAKLPTDWFLFIPKKTTHICMCQKFEWHLFVFHWSVYSRSECHCCRRRHHPPPLPLPLLLLFRDCSRSFVYCVYPLLCETIVYHVFMLYHIISKVNSTIYNS